VRTRLFFLDWLRVLAFAALVLYHVGMYYVTWDFHVKSPFAGPGLEPWMKLTEPWRMSLLFIISGAATALMLRGRESMQMFKQRSRQLLPPLLCGVVLVVPLQTYFEVAQKFKYTGGFLNFLGLYFTHFSGFCSNGKCLVLPTWNHLWFLPYLWVYTLIVCAVLVVMPTAVDRMARGLVLALRGPALLVVPALLLLLIRLALFSHYPSTHALWGDCFNHAVYFGMFIAGMAFATQPEMCMRMQKARWPALILAAIFWAVLVAAQPMKPFEHAVVAVFQWSALVAALGFARQHLNRDKPYRAELTESVFPVYILHQTVLIVATQWLLPLQWRPLVEGPSLVLITFAVSYLGYRCIRRSSLLRPWFGMR
jgi:glucans biosynthesis protein C